MNTLKKKEKEIIKECIKKTKEQPNYMNGDRSYKMYDIPSKNGNTRFYDFLDGTYQLVHTMKYKINYVQILNIEITKYQEGESETFQTKLSVDGEDINSRDEILESILERTLDNIKDVPREKTKILAN